MGDLLLDLVPELVGLLSFVPRPDGRARIMTCAAPRSAGT